MDGCRRSCSAAFARRSLRIAECARTAALAAHNAPRVRLLAILCSFSSRRARACIKTAVLFLQLPITVANFLAADCETRELPYDDFRQLQAHQKLLDHKRSPPPHERQSRRRAAFRKRRSWNARILLRHVDFGDRRQVGSGGGCSALAYISQVVARVQCANARL